MLNGSVSPRSLGRPFVTPPGSSAWVERRATVENWIGRIGLPLYLVLLLIAALRLDWRAGASMSLMAAWVARFAPLGMLAVLALRRRRRRSKRYLYMIAPAVVGSSLLAAIVLKVEGPSWSHPGAFELLSAFLLCAFGAWLGASWLRGWVARFLIIPKLIVGALLLPVAAGSFVYLALESEPLELNSPTLTSDTRRRLYRILGSRNPKRLEPGATATLRLANNDINALLAWGASTTGDAHRAQVDLTGDNPAIMISTISPLPRGDAKYVNLVARGVVRVTDGQLHLDVRQLRVGSQEVPPFFLGAFSPLVAALANRSQDLRPFLGPVQVLRMNASGLSVTYGRAELPSGMIASLFEGDDSLKELQRAVSAHASHLLESPARLSAADRKFGASLESAFRYARERSKGQSAAVENQAAIFALGILLGHSRVEQLVGPVLGDADRREAASFRDATLRQRTDWTKHFFVSAAVTVLSRQGIGDGAGMLKEELDADGGSGFSFGDLLADRSGTTFAMAATRDEASARAMQDRLAQGYRVDDFVPAAADLPEGLTDAQLSARFGGVGGAGFRRVTDEIERRLAGCAAYRGRVRPLMAGYRPSS